MVFKFLFFDKLFVLRYLTTYICSDILAICRTKKKGRSQHSVVPDVVTNGYHAIPKKSQKFVPILSVIVHIGKSREYMKSAINIMFNNGKIYDN